MLTLILDSADKNLLVALFKDGKKLDEISYEAWQRQSELMIPELKNILDRNKINPKEVNQIVVTLGPGSYTGVRIALTIAKIYAMSLSIPCYAVSSLGALKNKEGTSICLINARSNRSYFGVYDANGEAIISDKVLKNDEVLNYINEHKSYHVCGDTAYLNISGENNDIASNMYSLRSKKTLVDNILALKAVYLKD